MQIEAGTPDALLTLTLRRTAGDSPERARHRLGLATAEFFRRLERRRGYHVERFVVAEKHKSGWPHLHLACRGWRFRAHAEISRLWREVTGDSTHVDVRRVPAKRAKRYIAKYLGKDLHRFGTAKRYWRTKGYLPADFGKPTEEEFERWQGWKHVREHPEDVVRGYRSAGWYALEVGQGEWRLLPPPWAASAPRGPPQDAAAGSAPGGGVGLTYNLR